jgi:hypothetical protein
MQYCLALGFGETPKFQDRAAWVLSSPAMGRFLGGVVGLKLLLVYGNHDGTQFISPPFLRMCEIRRLDERVRSRNLLDVHLLSTHG